MVWRLLLYIPRRVHLILQQLEEQRIEQWQKEWADKGEERAIALRKKLEAILKNPDTPPEKALQRQLKVMQYVKHVPDVPTVSDALGVAKPDDYKTFPKKQRSTFLRSYGDRSS